MMAAGSFASRRARIGSLLARSAIAAILSCTVGVQALAQAAASVDPLTATIDYSDASRFQALWLKTRGQPTVEQLQAEYLRGGGRGIEIFTPNRLIDAANLHRQIAAHRDWYEQAVSKCIGWIPASDADLRSIYLGLRGLLPEKPLPQVYFVMGAANSGGTAGPGAQVLGLEIVCRDAPTQERFRNSLRGYFAHETIHTLQREPAPSEAVREPLVRQMLVEGGADYISSIVTGAVPDGKREAFARAHEAEIWAQFLRDRPLANRGFTSDKGFTETGAKAFSRWFYSDQGLPAGWTPDMGYWLGMQIAKAYVEQAADRHAAMRELLALQDPAEILRKSGYGSRFTNAR